MICNSQGGSQSTYLVQRAVDGDHITLADHIADLWHIPAVKALFKGSWQLLVICVQQLLAVKALRTHA